MDSDNYLQRMIDESARHAAYLRNKYRVTEGGGERIRQRFDYRRANDDEAPTSSSAGDDGLDVLNQRLRWTTTCAVDTAVVDVEDELDGRPLTDDEWRAAVVADGTCRRYLTLLHPNAGLLPDSYSMPRCRAMKATATVRDVLEAVHEMTVTGGPAEIRDGIYFEGIRQISQAPLVYIVMTGS